MQPVRLTTILKFFAVVIGVAGSGWAAKKVISPTTTGSNDLVDITATIFMTEQEVTEKLGADPGKGIVVLEVRVAPKGDQPVQISPDDFILLAHDDGQRSKPFDPSQLAGKGALVVKTTASGTSVRKGPRLSVGGMSGGVQKEGESKDDKGTAEMRKSDAGDATLLKHLKDKQLPEKESAEPVEGFLYFPLDGKHKLKNLAVLYRAPTGKIDLEFEH